MTSKLFKPIDLDTAEELLDELTPHTGQIWQERNRNWIFRGQRDARWDLTPTALRPENLASSDPAEQALHEAMSALAFADGADDQGLPVPGDRPELRNHDIAHEWKPIDFPPIPYRNIFALAQHYGVPTRLLDWTRSPLAAAYFACVGVAQESWPPPVEPFAIWAVASDYIQKVSRKWNPGPCMLTVPAVSNPNLHAQKGVFTLVRFRPQPDVDDNRELPALDALIRSTADATEEPVLYKFTVPAREAGRLLRLLALNDISASSMYPGHRGVVKAMLEKKWHRDRPVKMTVHSQMVFTRSAGSQPKS